MPNLVELFVRDGLITIKNDAGSTLTVKISDYKEFVFEQLPDRFQRLEVKPLGLLFEPVTSSAFAKMHLKGPDFEVTMIQATFINMHKAVFSGHTYGVKLGPCGTCGQLPRI
jgi:hypothetical protein